jgi:hypothetical protein
VVALTCFGITLPSSGSVSSAFWEMMNRGAVDSILWMGVLCLVTWCVVITTHAHPQYSIDCSSIEHFLEDTRNAPWGWQCNAETCRSCHTWLINWMNNLYICCFSRIYKRNARFKKQKLVSIMFYSCNVFRPNVAILRRIISNVQRVMYTAALNL